MLFYKDIDREIINKLNYIDLINVCNLNSYFRNKVCDEQFFHRRLKNDYPKMKTNVNYIYKMIKMGYTYTDKDLPAKYQYRQVRKLIKRIARMKKTALRPIDEMCDSTGIFQYVTKTNNLNLIKYALSIYDFSLGCQAYTILNVYRPSDINIIKFFIERNIVSDALIVRGLARAIKLKNFEMIKYFVEI